MKTLKKYTKTLNILALIGLAGCAVSTQELLQKGPEATFTSKESVKLVAECIHNGVPGVRADRITDGIRLSNQVDLGFHGTSTSFLTDVKVAPGGGSVVEFYPGQNSTEVMPLVRDKQKKLIASCVKDPGVTDIPTIK